MEAFMAIGDFTGAVSSNLFSNTKSFGKVSVKDTSNPNERALPNRNSDAGNTGVSVSISSGGLAAYDASLNRIVNSIEFTQLNPAWTVLHGAQAAVSYEPNNSEKDIGSISETNNRLADDSDVAPHDNGIDWGSVSMNLGVANGGKGVYIEDLSKVADLALADAKQQLDHAFAQAGISNNPPVNISFDRMGNILIGEHPSKSKIQALFADNAELTNDVRTAYALKENAVQWQKAELYTTAYYQAYQTKGKAAANKLTELFLSIGDKKAELKYGNSGLDLSYDGASAKEYLTSIASRLGINKLATENIG